MRHIVDAIAAQGRHGDDELIHVSKNEIAGLDALAKKHFGKELPRNPRTGIKEASLFQDWFGQDVGTALGVIAPMALGFIPGVGIPAAIAAGAAMGAANQGLGKGGTTESALLGGVMGGIGGYGGAGIADSLSAAGASTLAQEGAGQAAVQGLGEAGQTAAQTSMSAMPNLAQSSGAALAEGATPAVMQGATNTAGVAGAEGATNFGLQGVSNAAATTPTAAQQMSAGWDAITKSPEAFGSFVKDNASTALKAGIGGYGSAVNMAQPEPIAIPGQEKSAGNQYEGELYYGPEGEIRSRAVLKAAEGGMMYGDYDAVDAQPDGGYAPGGLASFADGGDVKGDFNAKDVGTYMDEQGGLESLTPEEAKAARMMRLAGYLGPNRRPEGYADGGIASFGKGRYLQGPGDGMSDSIPADIDGKRPARLATGEFVIPADVVSGLGNGDSTSGAKQLHSMMDRVRMARTGTKKQGKQINPNKVMPV